MQSLISSDLAALYAVLPPHIRETLLRREEWDNLLEVVLDLGRHPTARFPEHEVTLSLQEVTFEDLEYVTSRIASFGEDNRAGIERTLHRISAIRNRTGRIVGLTCRAGRAVFGTITVIEELVRSGASLLLLGRPGVGKTTMLREVARVLADEMGKRVIIVDTSNEIAGDGDIPHPAIGTARRMQVPAPSQQHAVMIEAVENHMPETIVIDEIGTELDATAARTIAERGVQLVGTAHGNTLDNLILNPTLSDLVGGIQAVTLGDEEARRRGTQKTVLERRAPPTFDVVVEIQNFHRVAVHVEVAATVDALLRGQAVAPEVRWRDAEGQVHKESGTPVTLNGGSAPGRPPAPGPRSPARSRPLYLYPFGISRANLERAARELNLPVVPVQELRRAEAFVTSHTHYRRRPPAVRAAEAAGVPIYVVKGHTIPQLAQLLLSLSEETGEIDAVAAALKEAESVIQRVLSSREMLQLSPQNAYIRRLQHQLAQQYRLASRSYGREPYRAVTIHPPETELLPDEEP